jgi:hypothetical protein
MRLDKLHNGFHNLYSSSDIIRVIKSQEMRCDNVLVENLQEEDNFFFNLFIYGSGVESNPLLLQSFIGLLYQPCMIDDDDCGAISAMNEQQENQSTLRKPTLVSLCPPQIPYDLIWD